MSSTTPPSATPAGYVRASAAVLRDIGTRAV